MKQNSAINIKRFEKDLPMPSYKTKGAAAIDLYSRKEVTIKPGEVVMVPLNVAIEVPDGYFVLLANRSSTFKMGITCINGVGIGDSDFKGDNDEYHFPAYNFTNKDITIERGTRICQAVILSYKQANIKEVDTLKNTDRGGWGTTGKLA